MGSSKKKDKDKERSREERAERKRKKRDRERSRSKSKERDRGEREKRSHRHRHKHKKHHKKSSREDRDRSNERERSNDRDNSHERDVSRSRSRSASISISDLESVSDTGEFIEIKDDVEVQLEAPPPPKITRTASPPPPPSNSGNDGGRSGGTGGGGGGGGGEITLSIEETNRLRAKLGLKPLSVNSVTKPASEPKKEDADEDGMEYVGGGAAISTANQTVTVDGETFVHKPADNLSDKLKVEKLREKIKANKEKRLIKSKLSKIKTLGDSDGEDDSAVAWIKKSRKLAKDKAEAEKRAKMMEELDEQFGIGDMVNQEITEQKEKKYSHRNLAGLKIQHNMDTFNDGSTTILTLADGQILDDKAEDTLVNVNMVDDERTKINVENRKKKGDEVDYEAPEMDDFGNLVQKDVLTKYDEEIEGLKKGSFRIGFGGVAVRDDEELRQANSSVQKMAKLRKLQALDAPRAQLASEYYTQDEVVSFKKPKKKKKKKKFGVDDLEPIEDEGAQHLGSRAERRAMLEVQDNSRDVEVSTGNPADRLKTLRELMEEDEPINHENEEEMEVDEAERDDIELQEALARSRRAKLAKKSKPNSESITDMLRRKLEQKDIEEPKDDIVMDSETKEDLNMTLNTTDEFCRTLGEIPTYGLSGNRIKEEMGKMQYSTPKTAPETEPRGAWEEVGIDDIRVEISDDRYAPILEEEPDAAIGVANALKLAMQKGYLEKDQRKGASNAALQHLQALNYSIEDKSAEDDRGRRGGGHDRYSGPLSDFVDKEFYRPEVRLEYVDDEGRKLCSKEAFRYLSHKFHGKGSGKNKTEKRMKKWNEELLMKHMSSSDTPLQTLERQREKQKQLAAPYLILSGNKNQEAMALDVKK